MPNYNPSDSTELAAIRYRAREAEFARGRSEPHLTAYLLGTYAGEWGCTIADFGGHSARWIRLFLRGATDGRERRASLANRPKRQ